MVKIHEIQGKITRSVFVCAKLEFLPFKYISMAWMHFIKKQHQFRKSIPNMLFKGL